MTTGIASLGMYDHGPQQVANDRLWNELARILRARGVAGVPDRLERRRSVQDTWHHPDLLFGQICGYPLVTDPSLALRVIGVPVYDAPGCGGGLHRSFLITRQEDAASIAAYRGKRAAINDRHSNTGTNLFRALIADLAGSEPFFSEVRETGAHRQSISAIVMGEADIAAIDAVTYAAVLRAEPELATTLRILGSTAESATPPFVTSRNTSIETVAALRMALADITTDPGLADVRATLFLGDILPGSLERYAPLRTLESDAVAAGYPDLR
ncbi:phosphate/phosphite/phosphonate ABC transporter substrate-binding protein [Sphingomonas sp. ERG5]|uniref:phosphate/phosphite/phosphonate ABC transporter substrate-binding protein n=1 Tax=Sphingomonas sp. ERG5 TaxID=1381597 RepID=UPI00068EFC20|nr:PhnD/SsuA/transferrin family substrate-binding protein [Sphingomonas sp. ERG5]